MKTSFLQSKIFLPIVAIVLLSSVGIWFYVTQNVQNQDTEKSTQEVPATHDITTTKIPVKFSAGKREIDKNSGLVKIEPVLVFDTNKKSMDKEEDGPFSIVFDFDVLNNDIKFIKEMRSEYPNAYYYALYYNDTKVTDWISDVKNPFHLFTFEYGDKKYLILKNLVGTDYVYGDDYGYNFYILGTTIQPIENIKEEGSAKGKLIIVQSGEGSLEITKNLDIFGFHDALLIRYNDPSFIGTSRFYIVKNDQVLDMIQKGPPYIVRTDIILEDAKLYAKVLENISLSLEEWSIANSIERQSKYEDISDLSVLLDSVEVENYYRINQDGTLTIAQQSFKNIFYQQNSEFYDEILRTEDWKKLLDTLTDRYGPSIFTKDRSDYLLTDMHTTTKWMYALTQRTLNDLLAERNQKELWADFFSDFTKFEAKYPFQNPDLVDQNKIKLKIEQGLKLLNS